MAKIKRTFVEINGQLEEALQDPQVRQEVEAMVEDMHEADRKYALAELRKAASKTQDDLGRAMGVAQNKISRIENGGDMLLSTLTRYLAAVGDRPRIVVTIGGRDMELELTPEH